jgi:hypothetical protein
MAEWFGVEVEMISPKVAFEKWPLLRIDDVLGAAWLPHDGKLIPKRTRSRDGQRGSKAGAQRFLKMFACSKSSAAMDVPPASKRIKAQSKPNMSCFAVECGRANWGCAAE